MRLGHSVNVQSPLNDLINFGLIDEVQTSQMNRSCALDIKRQISNSNND